MVLFRVLIALGTHKKILLHPHIFNKIHTPPLSKNISLPFFSRMQLYQNLPIHNAARSVLRRCSSNNNARVRPVASSVGEQGSSRTRTCSTWTTIPIHVQAPLAMNTTCSRMGLVQNESTFPSLYNTMTPPPSQLGSSSCPSLLEWNHGGTMLDLGEGGEDDDGV